VGKRSDVLIGLILRLIIVIISIMSFLLYLFRLILLKTVKFKFLQRHPKML